MESSEGFSSYGTLYQSFFSLDYFNKRIGTSSSSSGVVAQLIQLFNGAKTDWRGVGQL